MRSQENHGHACADMATQDGYWDVTVDKVARTTGGNVAAATA